MTATLLPIARDLLTAERDRHAAWLAGDWSSRTASGLRAERKHREALRAVTAELDAVAELVSAAAPCVYDGPQAIHLGSAAPYWCSTHSAWMSEHPTKRQP